MDLGRPKVRILGAELAGTVDAIGEGVTKLVAGDAVYGDISEAGFGGFAEYACVSEDALRKKPAAMTFEQAAALPHAAMLALQGLVDVGRIGQGEKVLINGAGGGVGTLGVAYLRCLRPGGRYVTVGGDTGRLLQLVTFGGAMAKARGKQARVVALKPNKDLDLVSEMFETVGLKTVIDGPYRLADVREAMARFGRAEHLGKIVITVAGR